jgi:hypothetical protein
LPAPHHPWNIPRFDYRSIAIIGEIGRELCLPKEGKGIETRPPVASKPLTNAPAMQTATGVSLMAAPVSA